MNNSRSAKVFVRNEFAGILKESDEGYEFIYDPFYLKREDSSPVSLTIPLSKEVYKSKVLFPFFDGLIPEGWLLEQVCRNWKISTKDRFGILLVSCADATGNVSIMSEE